MKLNPFVLIFVCLAFSLAGIGQSVQPIDDSHIHEKTIIPFTISEANNIIFRVVLNGTDSLNLYFDTGGTDLVLRHAAIKERTTLLKGKNKAYQEEDYEPLEELNTLELGSLVWDSLTVYPVGVGPLEADGHFGWDLFENKIVELDYDRGEMIIHPALPGKLDDYAKLEIEYSHTLFCIQTRLQVSDETYPARYLFDTGFQRSIILDKELRAKNGFPHDLPVIKESKLRNGAGEEFINKVVRVERVCFADLCAENVPIQLLSTPNPARFETHILGNELLKRFNTILDFQNHFVYLKGNSLMDEVYVDAAKE